MTPAAYLVTDAHGRHSVLLDLERATQAAAAGHGTIDPLVRASEAELMLQALRRAVLALAFAAEKSDAMRDDYNAVSAAIARATGCAP